MRNTVMSAIANLRSSGLLLGLRSVYGASMRANRPMPGIVTPATIGWNIVSSSWRPRKYHGALDGFGVRLMLASVCSGAFTNTDSRNANAVTTSAATNSTASRCGHTWTLSIGADFTSWIDPDFTTVRRRWVWPPGPTPTGGAAVGGAVAVATPPPDGASATSVPLAFALAAFERSSKWAGILLSASLGGAAGAS